jgi:hypothetical protein
VATVFEEAKAATEPPDLVEVVRSGLDNRASEGFVVGVSSELLLLHTLSDRLDLDGYTAFRVRDITDFMRDFPRKGFYLKALELKGNRPALPAGIDIATIQALLKSVERAYPLVVLHRERVVPGECEIGRIKLTSESTYALRRITPTATWEDDDKTYRYADVTRVGFDSEYENTLALVAGSAV